MTSNLASNTGSPCSPSTGVIYHEAESWRRFFDSSQLFYTALKQCRVRGVAIVKGSGKTNSDGQREYEALMEELIGRDIMVIFSACSFTDAMGEEFLERYEENSTGTGLAEFCDHLEIPPFLFVGEGADSDISSLLENLSSQEGIGSGDFPIREIGDFDTEKFDREIHSLRLALEWYDHYDVRYSPYS
ncbi:MAG: hypothetical protein PQJ59_05715 [Spirochaetales bacterium]|nr:hypothetical protein [Spirochaetales bacterium]